MSVHQATDLGGVHERMERMYRPQRYIYDLTRRHYLLGRDRLIRDLDLEPGQAVLEVGCGTGRNLVAIGQLYPGVLLCGVEPSRTMLEASAAALSRRRLYRSARLVYGTAETVAPEDFGVSAFDRIVISYCLSMVADPAAVLERVVTFIRPGGSLELVDFGPMHGLPAAVRRALVAWLDKFGVEHKPAVEPTLRRLAADGAGVVERRSIAGGYAEIFRFHRCTAER